LLLLKDLDIAAMKQRCPAKFSSGHVSREIRNFTLAWKSGWK